MTDNMDDTFENFENETPPEGFTLSGETSRETEAAESGIQMRDDPDEPDNDDDDVLTDLDDDGDGVADNDDDNAVEDSADDQVDPNL